MGKWENVILGWVKKHCQLSCHLTKAKPFLQATCLSLITWRIHFSLSTPLNFLALFSTTLIIKWNIFFITRNLNYIKFFSVNSLFHFLRCHSPTCNNIIIDGYATLIALQLFRFSLLKSFQISLSSTSLSINSHIRFFFFSS